MPFLISGTSPSYTIALCLEKVWAVGLACDGCDRAPVRWDEEALARLPTGATIAQIATWARCSACGSAEGRLFTRAGYWGAPAGVGRG